MEEYEVRWQDSESGEFKKIKVKIEPEMTFGARNQCMRESTTYDATGPKIDLVLQQELMVMKMVKEAPFEINLDNIRRFHPDDGDMLIDLGKKKELPNNKRSNEDKDNDLESKDEQRGSENTGESA